MPDKSNSLLKKRTLYLLIAEDRVGNHRFELIRRDSSGLFSIHVLEALANNSSERKQSLSQAAVIQVFYEPAGVSPPYANQLPPKLRSVPRTNPLFPYEPQEPIQILRNLYK